MVFPTLTITACELFGCCVITNLVCVPVAIKLSTLTLAAPEFGLSNTLIATASTTCPGTISSGAGLLVGVTKPSPSTRISSAARPVAVL